MSTRATLLFSLILTLTAFFTGRFFLLSLPPLLAVHFDLNGDPNGYIGRDLVVICAPLFSFVLALLLLLLPAADPLKVNVALFRRDYNSFIILLLLFLLYTEGLLFAWNAHVEFNFTMLLIPALAYLWFSLGVFLPKVKRNWFIGIRTPWTYGNEYVWDRTHGFAGILFKCSAATIFSAIFFPQYKILLLLAPILASVFIPIIYSFVLFKRLRNDPGVLPTKEPLRPMDQEGTSVESSTLDNEASHREIIVQSSMKEKTHAFVMRGDSKTSSVFGEEALDDHPQSSRHFESAVETTED